MTADLGVLSAHTLAAFQEQLYSRIAEAGHHQLRRRHGAVMAYLDLDGTRASDLAERSGTHKQVIGTLVDELETLGYVTRQPDPADRRAKLIVPTELGREQIRLASTIIAEIERSYAERVGAVRFAAFKEVFTEIAGAPYVRSVPGAGSGRPAD
ncbi:MarR family winged helix-turn-helix transcriptional regulator [Actinoplanes solisilvae]|uniref:MarR family winged helix-turn-helix transcriptional regulator n=1 Tax=Actinoplanes solisilvae TaxID=2486853 RepID=UPI0025464DFE|nr:MarR family transcriptional regulator [Actinoplanes solisilvae]